MLSSYLIFLFGFVLAYYATRNIFSVLLIFGLFYFLATCLSSNEVLLIASISFTCLAFGSFLFNVVNKTSPKFLLTEFRKKPFSNESVPHSWLILPLFVVFILSLSVSIFYYANVGISLAAAEVGYERLTNRYSVPGARVMQRFFRVCLPVCVICYYLFKYSPTLRKYYSSTLFLVLVFLTSFFLIAGGMRGNIVIFFFIPFLYVRSLVNKVSFFELFIAFMFTFSLGLLVTVKMYSSASFSLIFQILWARFTTGASDGLGVIVGGYTEAVGFQLGYTFYSDIASIFSKLGILTYQYVSLGEEIAKHLLGSRHNGERAAVYFSGELYHNFGYPGVIVGSVIIGYFLQYLYMKTIRAHKDIFFISLSGFITAAFASILGGPVLASLIDYAAIFVLILLIIFFTNLVVSLFASRIYVFGRWIKIS